MYPRLRNLREDKDLNQSEIAEILNISQTTYSRYESGILCLFYNKQTVYYHW